MTGSAWQSGSRRLGLLGGTFDPFHDGHLAVVRQVRAAAGLDGLWVVPSARPPHRPPPSAPPGDRLAMVTAALAGEPGVTVLSLEVDRPGPSFTLDTVRALLAPVGRSIPGSWEPPDAPHVVLLMGVDAARDARSWRGWDELRDMVEVAVFGRRGSEPLSGEETSMIGVDRWLEMDLPDISATELRRRLGAGEAPSEIPPAVRRIITERGLYRNPSPGTA